MSFDLVTHMRDHAQFMIIGRTHLEDTRRLILEAADTIERLRDCERALTCSRETGAAATRDAE